MWPDTAILRENGFQVMTADEHKTLYPMLAKGRFDYFPRALHEALNEELQYEDLVVEKRFLIYYDSPFFFFVNKQNPRLAKRISYGLKQAISDGSFDEFFNHHPVTSGVLGRAKLTAREVIKLENPLLTEETKQALSEADYSNSCTK